jgi:hypothetical protein
MKGLLGTVAKAICLFLPSLTMAATQYEAESATRSGGANVNTNHAGYTGTGFVDGYINNTTAQTAFTVSAASAGSATLTTRYSAGNGTSTNTGLYVNGTKIKNITFNATSNWDTWASETETVPLNAGNNTIAYKAETSSATCINLDNILVQTATPTYSLTVLVGSVGGSIIAPATSPTVVNQGVATPIAASPAIGYNFVNWSVTSGAANIANPASPSTTVTLNSGNATIAANFALKTYQLVITAGTGGSITAPATSPITVNHGAAINIAASPAAGLAFANWTVTNGTAMIANPTSASTTLTLTSGNAAVQANFTPVTYSLTMTNDGHGTTSPSGTLAVNFGVATSIAAIPASGYQFLNWTIPAGSAATIASATSASTTVTLTGNATVRANFTATTPVGASAVTYAAISSPVPVTASNTVVLALPFTAPSAGYITVVATGLYGTNNAYTHEQRGLESFVTLNSASGGSLSGFAEKTNLIGSAQYVNETAGFPVSAGFNTVRLIVSPRTTLTTTTYSFAKCDMTIVFSPQKM